MQNAVQRASAILHAFGDGIRFEFRDGLLDRFLRERLWELRPALCGESEKLTGLLLIRFEFFHFHSFRFIWFADPSWNWTRRPGAVGYPLKVELRCLA